jgi:hypothetical protein
VWLFWYSICKSDVGVDAKCRNSTKKSSQKYWKGMPGETLVLSILAKVGLKPHQSGDGDITRNTLFLQKNKF